ncbi:hypothetical protein Kpol_1008p25 [Vanderwaltozyma polyspora DSM 70294]|uniref:SH3 domain-containing protein n=1 Tax=Vanderwaltozyma polyspora (strain ATCC 22028 / DSM 70294 / BCRC 21397 / CBS 2163 / NBRC 10782 / NRRL Y-8283 / UCD 57-17) TaxID=436907 RepID=A7TPY8_VANPO|nr:uncharacterized protein Kpol_1008p25 [Vanderwaltozyma polyspora DSM 70294]EDO15686.1 hypothetical protein Kpol_1008p25 [Vanderwaltozyma polyspora DSM 70294]
MGLNNPIPRSLKSETKKAAKVLASFVKPNQVFGADQVIPPHVLRKAKGLAIITVLKAGFLFSGRAGSGVIVARLPDGSWSAPSAIGLAGGGAGGMVGVELTDFVFILNTKDAVKSFSEFGTITLGGNVSVSAGPLGRTAEYAATASTGAISSVYSYSKSKGLFAGVSLEGSVIIERREANRKFYGNKCTTKMILSGRIRAPPHADPLFRVLESRAFGFDQRGDDRYDDDFDEGSEFYNDIPDSFGTNDDSYSYRDRDQSSYSRRSRGGSRGGRGGYDDFDDDFDSFDDGRRRQTRDDDYYSDDREGSDARDYYASQRRSSNRRSAPRTNTRWEDEVYDRDYDRDSSSRNRDVDDLSNRFSKSRISQNRDRDSHSRPAAEKPSFGGTRQSSSTPKAIALYSFAGEESGDLRFKKGDVITILKKSDSQDDWWTGRVNTSEGIFPANYVELV